MLFGKRMSYKKNEGRGNNSKQNEFKKICIRFSMKQNEASISKILFRGAFSVGSTFPGEF